MSSLGDLLDALPKPKANPVSLLDALPDPNLPTTMVDYESKPSLLESNVVAMSAAEQFAVLMHAKEEHKDKGMVISSSSSAAAARPNKKRKVSEAPLPKKKRERRQRGKEIKQRTRGNQRG